MAAGYYEIAFTLRIQQKSMLNGSFLNANLGRKLHNIHEKMGNNSEPLLCE